MILRGKEVLQLSHVLQSLQTKIIGLCIAKKIEILKKLIGSMWLKGRNLKITYS